MSAKILKTLLLVLGILAFMNTASAQRILEDGWGTDDWGSNEPVTTETRTAPETNVGFRQEVTDISQTSDNRTVITVENEVTGMQPPPFESGVQISYSTGPEGGVRLLTPDPIRTALGWEINVFAMPDGTAVAVGIGPSRDTPSLPTDREVREVADLAPPPAPPPSPTPTPSPTPPPAGAPPPPGVTPPAIPPPGITPPGAPAVPLPPPSITLTANPAGILKGQSSAITWSVSGASDCAPSSSPNDPDWQASPEMPPIPPFSGYQIVSPGQTTTYTLECIDGFARSASVTVAVSASKWWEIVPRLFPFLERFFALIR